VCLENLKASAREHETAWCVSYAPRTEPGQYVIGPEGIICVDKQTGRVVEEMIFHASPPPCPAEKR
jgi:hypothetical protein